MEVRKRRKKMKVEIDNFFIFVTIKGEEDPVPCQPPYLSFFFGPITSNNLAIEFPEIALRLHEIVSHVINIFGMKILWRRSNSNSYRRKKYDAKELTQREIKKATI